MKKENLIILCAYAFCGCFIFNKILGLLGLISIFVFITYKKDTTMQQRIMSAMLLVISVLAFQVVFELVFGTINYMMLLGDHLSVFMQKLDWVITMLSYIYMIVFIVLGIVFAFVKDRDMPIYSTLSKIILGNYVKKQENENTVNETKNDNTETE